MNNKINFEELPKNDQNVLNQIYGKQLIDVKGYNPKRIAYIKELEDYEKVFFSKNDLISANQFVQKLYKISGKIIPLKFNLAVSNLINDTEELRMNYCPVDDRTIKVYFEQRNDKPEIIYRNLENVTDIDLTLKNIIEADMRQNFDLLNDQLIRFSVFHTGEEEYAVLMTVAKLIEDSVDEKNLILNAMNLSDIIASKDKPKLTNPQVSEEIKKYWRKMLEDLPKIPSLPYEKTSTGKFKQKAYRFTIPADIMSDLREKAKSNKMMLMSIFETAWSILLQEFNSENDIAFATVVPDKSNENFNIIPIRMKIEDQMTIQTAVNQQFKQLLISQSYASLKVIEPQGKKFDHILNFIDFLREERCYSETQAAPYGQLVLQNSLNTQSMKLGLYFHYAENGTAISILYDENKFDLYFGEKLSKRYILILQQMLTDWNLNCDQFIDRLSNRIKSMQIESESKEEDPIYLLNFISQLELLQGMSGGTLQQILNMSKVETYFEGDRISGAKLEDNLIFVMNGELIRSIEKKDGWYNTLDLITENGWINETVLLEERKTKMSVEVWTDTAKLMLIPAEEIKKRFGKFEYKFLQYILNQMEKYQRLWIQS